MTRATIIGLNLDEYHQGLRENPFMVILDRCNGCCNTFDDLSRTICVPS